MFLRGARLLLLSPSSPCKRPRNLLFVPSRYMMTTASSSPPSPSSSPSTETTATTTTAITTTTAEKKQSTTSAEKKQSILTPTLEKKSPFISSHFKIETSTIIAYLERKKLEFKISSNEVILKNCQFCHDTKGKEDNMWKMYLNNTNGTFFCHRCSEKGSWFDFKKSYGDSIEMYESNPIQNNLENNNTTKSKIKNGIIIPDQKIAASYAKNLEKYPELIQYLTGKGPNERHLDLKVLKHYEVGAAKYTFPMEGAEKSNQREEHLCVTFPWIENKIITRIKVRSISKKRCMRLDPSGGKMGFFGLNTVPKDAMEIVLTEGEFDAMAVYQSTGVPAISLPNGASSLPESLLPLLEKFTKIYIWMDDDLAGQSGAQKFSSKLGIKRCLIVHTKDGDPHGPKDANEALVLGRDLKILLQKAERIPHEQILQFSALRSEIHRELKNPDQSRGFPLLGFPKLTDILRGHRAGELTVLTGPTGIGKTSLLSQISIGLAKSGVRTLWGSFEIGVGRLAKKMVSQFAEKNMEKHLNEFDFHADNFNSLPIYFLKFFGSTHVDKILDAMEYSVYTHDINHIILDNLQFMTSGQGRGWEKFDIMDEAIAKFRQFSTDKNVHITIVIHPRKSIADLLTTHDVFGSAKATQEADNVIIMQNSKAYKYIDVRKNRFSGHLGKVPIAFSTETSLYRELPPEEIQKLENGVKKNGGDELYYSNL